jgi:hypothetical protein
MRSFIVKGKPSRNDLRSMLRRRAIGEWVTKRPPREWSVGDEIFIWEGTPTLAIVGVARLHGVQSPDRQGVTSFVLRYETSYLEGTLGIERLRADPTVRGASFLKAGAAGTVFPLSERQAARVRALLKRINPALRFQAHRPETNTFVRALSIRQPWAELIMRRKKTIEVRSRPTHVRGTVLVYASKAPVHRADVARVEAEYGLDVDSLPVGVIVGSVEIVGCRPLRKADSDAAAFPVDRDTEDYAWELAHARRFAKRRRPAKQPQPTFFRPF